VIVATIVLAVMFGLSRCMSEPARREATAAKVDATLSDARAASGKDAVDAVAGGATRDAAIERVTRENDDAIRNAPGAGATVDAGVDGVGRASLCRRAAYRDSEQCQRMLGARP
jgi:hypothetical protein